jgi:HD-GYP domain-containing protein (c-di-GMP phosphodiesterase class II)
MRLASDAELSEQESLADEPFLRRTGRSLVLAMYGALRAIRLYPVENTAVQNALEELATVARAIIDHEGDLELRVSGEFIFVNTTRLRMDLHTYASFGHLLAHFRTAGIGTLHAHADARSREWLVLLSLTYAVCREVADIDDRLSELEQRLGHAGVTAFECLPTGETDGERADQSRAREAAKRTYAQSVAVTKDVINSIRLGRSANITKVKRVVQSIVDQILSDEQCLIGLTTLRDFDEYTFVHSVNVCIFSVALGRRLGLEKLQLYDLGLAALLHDIGKSRVSIDLVHKAETLTDEEWRELTAHTWLGVLALFQFRGQQELPYRAMVVAYEHHMRVDLTGYPRNVRPRALAMFSKIVAVADGFDAATTGRAYLQHAMIPADVIREMRDNPKRGMDAVVVKAFSNLIGVYPVGTLVVFDTFELGIVHANNPSLEMMSRPVMRVISDPQGNLLYPGELIDLAEESHSGSPARTIIRTADPDRYGIRVSDYFV